MLPWKNYIFSLLRDGHKLQGKFFSSMASSFFSLFQYPIVFPVHKEIFYRAILSLYYGWNVKKRLSGWWIPSPGLLLRISSSGRLTIYPTDLWMTKWNYFLTHISFKRFSLRQSYKLSSFGYSQNVFSFQKSKCIYLILLIYRCRPSSACSL